MSNRYDVVLTHPNGSLHITPEITIQYCTIPGHALNGHTRDHVTHKDLFGKQSYSYWRKHYQLPLKMIRQAHKIINN